MAKYGLLVPHFGKYASRSALVGMAPQIEASGFDSLWVRDHVIFHPHEFEDPDRTHVEPFIVLSAIAAVTKQITLGFGSLIPHRHPVYTALSLASLEWLAGPKRVIAGWGLGTFQHEFEALGLGEYDRRELLPEQLEIIRELWTGGEVTYRGNAYSFESVDIHPEPAGNSIPQWYCGGSAAAVRRAVTWGLDGWMPGRITFPDFASRLRRLEELKEAHNVERAIEIAAIPITSPGESFDDGASKINVDGILAEARKRKWLPGESGVFEQPRDVAGAILCGSAEEIAADVRRYEAMGAGHIVFDLRARFDGWEEHVRFLAEEVLPRLRSAEPNHA